MPTPKKGYYTQKGERVPGVTTILGRFKDSGALIHWANQIAYTPYREVRAMIERILKQGALDPGTVKDCKELLSKPEDFCDYRIMRDTAAGIGTVVHSRVDNHIRGATADVLTLSPEEMESSQTGFNAFLEWAGSTQFELAEAEMQIVSEVYRYGGTPDVIMVRGQRTVGDWKTGDLYPEQILPQLAAYENLLVEQDKITGGIGGHAMSINKKTGGFVHRFFTPEEMSTGWSIFTKMRELYDLVKFAK
jgi:hypothetical protein